MQVVYTDPLRIGGRNRKKPNRYGCKLTVSFFSFLFKSNKKKTKIVGSEESSSSPVVRSGDGIGGGSGPSGNSSSARKKKYAPNEQGRYVCTQCGRSYAAYHVNFFPSFLFFFFLDLFDVTLDPLRPLC